MVTKTIKVLDIYSKPNNKKSSSTPAKGATPAKKQKLGLDTTGVFDQKFLTIFFRSISQSKYASSERSNQTATCIIE